MSPRALNSAGCIQFREEANQHAVSVPKRRRLAQGLCNMRKHSPKKFACFYAMLAFRAPDI